MELREFVSAYDGEVLFSVKEPASEGGVSTIITFENGEHDALREDLLARKVEKYKVESAAKSSGFGKTYANDVIVIFLAAEEKTI